MRIFDTGAVKVENMETSSLRVYGGVDGDHRQAERRAQLLEAGLDLLGGSGGDSTLTVRGACKRAGLTTRYFYENFADRDALSMAVYDHVIDEIATSTFEALEATAPDATAMTRAALGNIVQKIVEDPRRGRLLFSAALTSPVIADRRLQSTRLFVDLLSGQARNFYELADGTEIDLTAQFLVGGLARALTAWLDGALQISEDDLVDRCTELFLARAENTAPPAAK